MPSRPSPFATRPSMAASARWVRPTRKPRPTSIRKPGGSSSGKLYLFSGKEGLEEDFDARAGDVIAKADVKWPEIQQKEFQARQGSGN